MSNLEKNLGDKNCELTSAHIDEIRKLYLGFEENDISKIYPNEYFGYNKITVERPLRLSAKFTNEAISELRFDKAIIDEMKWVYNKFADKVYSSIKDLKPNIEKYFDKSEIKLNSKNKKNLFSAEFWKNKQKILVEAQKLMGLIGQEQYDDFNKFSELVSKAIKDNKLKIDTKALKNIYDLISWKNEDAERVIKKIEKNGTIIYEPDSELRDSENVPLDESIQTYFKREVLQHVPDAWIDHSKTVKGYKISFTRYFYNYVPSRSIEEISKEIIQLEKETDGILNEIVSG